MLAGGLGSNKERVAVEKFSVFKNFDNESRLEVLIRLELRENRKDRGEVSLHGLVLVVGILVYKSKYNFLIETLLKPRLNMI
jgi:hypothetical protein